MNRGRELALLRLLRAAPGSPGAVEAAVAGADFDQLARDASRHGLAGLVHHLLTQAGALPPGAGAQTLAFQAMGATASAMRVKRLLFLALDALAAQGVRPVLLKGYGLASRIYPAALLRATSDVDLLVAPFELGPARAAMGALGLASKKESDDYYPPAYHHHRAFAGPSGLVELHFRLLSNAGSSWEAAGPLSRAVSGALDGREVRFLCPEDEVVYLALHAANHMLGRLGWLYDLKLLLLAYPAVGWDQVAAIARGEAGMPAPAFFALEAARRIAGAAVPQRALEALAPPRLAAAASRRLFSEGRLLDGFLADHKLVWAAAKLLLSDSPAQVALFALRRLTWDARQAALLRWSSRGELDGRRANGGSEE